MDGQIDNVVAEISSELVSSWKNMLIITFYFILFLLDNSPKYTANGDPGPGWCFPSTLVPLQVLYQMGIA
jgi:hypothetical protein